MPSEPIESSLKLTVLKPKPSLNYSSSQRPYVISAVIAILIILVFNAILLWQKSNQVERNAEIDTENASLMLAKSISGIFDTADALLQAVEFQYTDDRALNIFNAQRFNEYLMRALDWAPGFDNIGLIDAKGFYRFGKDSDTLLDLSDRAFFKTLRDRPAGSGSGPMIFSEPIYTRITQQWALIMARRVEEPGGGFGGVVIVRWNLDQVTELLASVEMGPRATLALWSSDMAQISSYPTIDGDDSGAGNRWVSQMLIDSIQQSPVSGFYRAVSSIDNVERYYAYRRVADYPFYVIAGKVANPGFFVWSNNTPIFLMLSGFMILLVLLWAWHMSRITRRRIRGELDNFAQRILSASPVAMFLLNKQGVVTMANPATERLFEYKNNELVGISANRLQPDGFIPTPKQRLLDSKEVAPMVTEGSYQRRYGSLFTALCAVSGLPDVKGETHYYLETVVDITELKRIQEDLRELAETDDLTGLLNRRSGDLVIDQAIREATVDHTPFSVIMGDLDYFKRVNDKYGHLAGDRILVSVANLLKVATRHGDHCIRWGGEEFLILLPGCLLPVAKALADRVRAQIEGLVDEEIGQVTMSFGVGEWIKPETPDTLISRVDQALYQAKGAGRNRIAQAQSECKQRPS